MSKASPEMKNGLSYAPPACLAGANFSGQGVNFG
jgi:hypothetical protein